MSKSDSYTASAADDAADFVENFIDEAIEQIVDNGEASDDFLNDYPDGDSYHHESHVDKWYNLSDAAQVLDELGDYEETDDGLWQGLKPRDAISAQAAYTYGNAVYSMAQDIVKKINGDNEVQEWLEFLVRLNVSEPDDQTDLVACIDELYPDEPGLTQEQAVEKTKSMLAGRVKAVIENSR